MSYETEDFRHLYQVVTDHLRKFVVEAQKDPGTPISKQEADWLNALIKLFMQLYDDWQIDDELKGYLSALVSWPAGSLRPRRVHRLFRLAGHVYLHVAFDLTRGLAGTVPGPAGPIPPAELLVPKTSPSFVKPPSVTAGARPEARTLFHRAAPAFDRSLESDEFIELLGKVTFWAKLLSWVGPGRREQLAKMVPWVRALRSEAWITAERILDTTPSRREDLVRRLRQAVIDAQTRVAKRFRISDAYLFSYPTLAAGAPAAALAWMQTPGVQTILVAVVLLAFGAFLVRQARDSVEDAMEAVDALGEAMLDVLVTFDREKINPLLERSGRRRPRLEAGPALLSLREVPLRDGDADSQRLVSFDVREGEIFGIVGPGAENCGVLDAIAGTRTDWRGEVVFRGRALRGMRPTQRFRLGIVRVPKTPKPAGATLLFDILMRARQPLRRSGVLPRLLDLEAARGERRQGRRLVLRLIDFFELDEHAWHPTDGLPLALRKRVAMAAAMAAEPQLLLLEEPMAAVSDDEQGDMATWIQRINAHYRTTIVVVESSSASKTLDLFDRTQMI